MIGHRLPLLIRLWQSIAEYECHGHRRDRARVYRSLRREMQARRTRARVVAAAAQRFLAHGYAGTTMRAVALNAGVALPTVELPSGPRHGC